MSQNKTTQFWSAALVNVAIIALVGLALYLTHSLWSLIGLLCLLAVSRKPTKIKTECPKCQHEFTAVEKDDEEDGE